MLPSVRHGLLVTTVLIASCSETAGAPSKDAGGGDTGASGDRFALSVACDAAVESLYGDPGPLGTERGAILKCARTASVGREALESAARALHDGAVPEPYGGKSFTSGVRTDRVLYRTERATVPPTPGYSVATVYLPDTPVASGPLPVVVAAHGSRGQGAKCAMSLLAPEADYINGDVVGLVNPYVGLGFAVIAPDWAGFANAGAANNPPSGFAHAEDLGRSILDAARAMRKLLGPAVSDKTVLVGHSQGGHAALAALALQPSYAPEVPVAAVVAAAPLWLPQRSWGALFVLEDLYKLGTSAAVPASIWYHYTHGELLDGPGGGLLPFKESVRPTIKKFVEERCYSARYPELEAVGDVMSQFYDPTFKDAVSDAAAFGAACPTDPTKKALCEKWMARYKADRPALAGAVAEVPTLLMRGGVDNVIPPDRFQCVTDVLQPQLKHIDWCFDAATDHSGILRAHADYAVEWVASKMFGTPITAACPVKTFAPVDDAGAPVKCATPPPNE